MKEKIEIHKKKVKNVTLKVKRDGSIHLTVPEAATDDYIERVIANKQEWIESQLKHFNENYEKPKEKEMVSGESFKYLGKNYRLKVIESKEEFVRTSISDIIVVQHAKINPFSLSSSLK